MNIILFGPPGSGKGTLSEIIVNNWYLEPFSVGGYIRKEVLADTDLGKVAKFYFSIGDIIPDNIMISVAEAFITKQHSRGFVLEGFPRTPTQMDTLEVWLKTQLIKVDYIINLEIERDIAIRRVLSRISCQSCGCVYNREFRPPKNEGICDICHGNLIVRRDDNTKTVDRRLNFYYNETYPILERMISLAHVITIDASCDVPTIYDQLETLF